MSKKLKAILLKLARVKEKIKKSEKPFKAGSPPLEVSLKDRMQKLASSTRLAKGPGLPVGVKDLKKAKLSSKQPSEIKGRITIISSQDDTSTSERRAVFETRSRSASFSEKRRPSIVSPSNSRSATPFSGRGMNTRDRAGSIDESASVRFESLSPSPIKKAAVPKAISKKKSKKRASGSSSSSHTD